MSASDASRKFSAVLGPPGQARTVLGVQYRPGLVPSGPSAAPRADDRRLAAIWSGKRTLPQQNSDHLLPCAVEGLLQVGEQLVGIHDSEHGETIVVTRGRATGRVKAWLASSLLMPYRPLQRPQRQIPIVWTSTGPRRPRLVDTRTVKHGHAHLP